MKRDNRQHMANTKQRRVEVGLCKSCGGEKERKALLNCDSCIECGTKRSQKFKQKKKSKCKLSKIVQLLKIK